MQAWSPKRARLFCFFLRIFHSSLQSLEKLSNLITITIHFDFLTVDISVALIQPRSSIVSNSIVAHLRANEITIQNWIDENEQSPWKYYSHGTSEKRNNIKIRVWICWNQTHRWSDMPTTYCVCGATHDEKLLCFYRFMQSRRRGEQNLLYFFFISSS